MALHVAWMPGFDHGSGPRLLGHILKQDPVFRDKSCSVTDEQLVQSLKVEFIMQTPVSSVDSCRDMKIGFLLVSLS